jgi:hypothetical protein
MKLACGMVVFLRMAFSDHRRLHYGEHAKKVVIHPEHYAELVLELEPQFIYFNPTNPIQMPPGALMFEGILVESSEEPGTPKLINCKNEVIYL